MKHVVIDPITRIEGHLRTEVTVDDGGKVTDAISSGTAWRGLELVMNDPIRVTLGRIFNVSVVSARQHMRWLLFAQ